MIVETARSGHVTRSMSGNVYIDLVSGWIFLHGVGEFAEIDPIGEIY